MTCKWFITSPLNNVNRFIYEIGNSYSPALSPVLKIVGSIPSRSEHIKLWKERLKIDGQQFHQYQENEQSPLILTHWTQKRPRDMKLGSQILALGQA
jgi:hypothetical protein